MHKDYTQNEGLGDLEVSEIKDIASGLPAITDTIKKSFAEMGAGRATYALLNLNQKGGIDCQSCAWADPDERTVAEFCESGAKALADEGTTKTIGADFFAKYSVAELNEQSDRWLNMQGRITEPLIRRENSAHYEPISWDEVFEFLAENLNALQSPDEAIFYTSGRTSNEAAFVYQLFARQFGTNNLPDCSNMCHESTSVGLKESIGLGKASIRLEDLAHADLIMIIGQNPGSCAPRMMTTLQEQKRAGGKLIAVNPLPEAGLMNFVNPNPQHYPNPLMFPIDVLGNRPTPLADLYLPIKIGGDMAFLKGLMKILLEKELDAPTTIFDHEFIAYKTEGYSEFIENLKTIEWQDILEQSGLTLEQFEETAQMFADAKRIVTCWAMGITQHKHAVATIQDIANLHFLLGQIGKPGAGLCPVRGHSNVQGDRTMGVWEKMFPEFREALEKEFKFKTKEENGFDAVKSLTAMHDKKARIFFAMGGNFLLAVPDTLYAEEALGNCDIVAQVITKLNRTALVDCKTALILPCLGRSEKDFTGSKEQFVTTESTMLNVQMSKGVLDPASEDLRSETWIACRLAEAVLKNDTTVDWAAMRADYDVIRESIARVVAGCEDYNQKVRVEGGFYLPNKPRTGEFPTETGKAKFVASPLIKIELKPSEMILTTIRAHNQFNSTVYQDNDRYRGIDGSRRVVFMNEADIATRDLQAGQVINLISHFDDGMRRAENFVVVPYPIPKDCCAAYYPETNILIPHGSVAEKSNCPTSKSVIVTVEPHLNDGKPVFWGTFER